jgi:uncharacterized membrane protein
MLKFVKTGPYTNLNASKMNLILFRGQYSKLTIIKRALIFLIAICLVQACKKSDENNNPVDCGSTSKSFVANIKPIMQTSCAFDSDCHGSGSTSGPGSLFTYTEIFNARSVIRSAVVSGEMPKGATLTSAEKNAIACWIDNGAPNN